MVILRYVYLSISNNSEDCQDIFTYNSTGVTSDVSLTKIELEFESNMGK